MAQALVTGLSWWKSGFNPGSVHVRFVNKVAMVEVLSEYFILPLSVSLHQCSILIFILILLVSERKVGDERETSDSGQHYTKNIFTLFITTFYTFACSVSNDVLAEIQGVF